MARRFETTRWSLVLAARDGGTPASRDALAALCEAYWEPLYAHVRRRCGDRERAEDLTQGYFARLLEGGTLRQVTPQAGRLRSFLLASLDHYLANEWDRERAVKRGGRRTIVSLDTEGVEERCLRAAASGLSPEEAFERRWAMTVLDRAMTALGRECAAAGRADQLEALKPALRGERPARPHRDVAEELGMSEGAVKVALHRLRRRLGELLREEVVATLGDPADVDAELRHLLGALGRRDSP